MPIEDVQYLLKNSVKDSVLLFIDSTHRDRQKYPTPSDYVVDLDEQIAQVYGIDILDAAIPSTMYNVDVNNNKMRCIAAVVSESEGALSTLGLSTTDEIEAAHLSSLNSVFTALGLASPLRTLWLPDVRDASYRVVVGSWASGSGGMLDALSPVSSINDIGAGGSDVVRYRMLRERRYASLPMWRLSRGSAPGSRTSVPADVPTRTLVSNNQTYLLNAQAPGADAAIAAVQALGSRDVQLQSYAIVPRGEVVDGGGGSELCDLVIYDVYAIDGSSQYDGVSAALFGVGGRLLTFAIDTISIEIGTYTSLNDIQGALQDGFDAKGVGVTVTSTTGRVTGNDNRGTFRFATSSDVRLILPTAFSNSRTTLGMDLDAALSINSTAREARKHGAVSLGGHVAPMYCSVLQSDGTQHLDTPGIVSLAGARYITLRCPEIEQHMSSNSRYGRHAVGIGVFKLLNTNEIAQLRFDYVSLVRKPFHPIARLTRLHFRFELPDGTLYDFKGINHQIMLTIKYYAPTAPESRRFGRSVLNPNYNPDFVDYMASQTDPFGPTGQRLAGFDPFDEDDTETEDAEAYAEDAEAYDEDEDDRDDPIGAFISGE